MAAQVASQNFDSLSVGALAGFVNVGSASFAVQTAGNISSANAFAESSPVDGDIAVYTSVTPPANQCVQYSVISSGDDTNSSQICPLLRCTDTSGTNGYLVSFNQVATGLTAIIYKKTGGTYTALLTGALVAGATAGTTYKVKAEATGTTIRLKFWLASVSEPGTWDISTTDATYASGLVGVRTQIRGTGSAVAIDDFYIGDAGATFPGPTTGTVTGSSTSATGTTQTFTLTTNLAWTGTPTLTLSGTATGTITQFSAFSAATTGTATILWTGDGTASVNATFSDSLAAGAAQSVTVSAFPVVIPSTVTIDQLATTALTATGFTGGSVTWSSGATGTATINSSTGVATGVAHGQATSQTATMTATGVANPAQTATCVVTVRAVSVIVSPSSATVGINATQTFTATVAGSTNTAVTWDLSAGTGSINASTGVYTAPSSAGSATVRATSTADSARTGTASVSIIVATTITNVGYFGPGYKNLAGTVGVTIYSLSGSTLTSVQSRTTAGIVESGINITGDYIYQFTGAAPGTTYIFVWDTGGSTPVYYTDTKEAYPRVRLGDYATGQDPATLILDAASADHVSVGTVGLKISNLDAAVSTRSTFASGGNVNVASYSTDAISAAAVSAAAVSKIQNGLSTFAGGPVLSVTAPVTVGTNNDKTGYALASDGLDAITATEPTISGDGAMSTWNFRKLLRWSVMAVARVNRTGTTASGLLIVKKLDGTTSTTQTAADEGAGVESLGTPS